MIAHGQFDGQAEALPQFGLNVAAGDDEGGTGRGPNFLVGVGGFFRSRRKDGEIDDTKSRNRVDVEHASVHEKFAEVFADISDGGGIRRAEVDEEDAFQFVKWVKWVKMAATERGWD